MRKSLWVLSLLLVVPLLAGPRTADATPTPDLPAYCPLGVFANSWQGLGVGPGTDDQWENNANWSLGLAPLNGAAYQNVCIPTGGVPHIRDGEESHLETLDVASGATLTIDQGGKLFFYGEQTLNQDSVVRSGGRIDVVGATLGGISKLHVLGTVLLKNNGPGAASTVLTRDCAYDSTPGPSYPGEEACTSPDPTPVAGPTGLLEVADGGTLDIQGGGVNLGDQFTLIVRGLMRVRAGAYVAADHGTRLELRPHLTAAAGTGTLRFEGDGGYLEGKITEDTGIATLSTLVNQGEIRKTGGTGRTLVSASYSQPSPGKVTVLTGTLLLPTGPTAAAQVARGVTYGIGRCIVAQTGNCAATTTPSFQQSGQFRVPQRDASGAKVVVRQLGTRTTADLGYPYVVHATGLDATSRKPAIITLRFDASVLNGKRWRKVKILRKASASVPYRVVKACLGTGRPPAGEFACVDRRGLAVSSRNVANTSGAPDVIMVVRTSKTSRWVAR